MPTELRILCILFVAANAALALVAVSHPTAEMLFHGFLCTLYVGLGLLGLFHRTLWVWFAIIGTGIGSLWFLASDAVAIYSIGLDAYADHFGGPAPTVFELLNSLSAACMALAVLFHRMSRTWVASLWQRDDG
jgi:hypothetical protein